MRLRVSHGDRVLLQIPRTEIRLDESEKTLIKSEFYGPVFVKWPLAA